MGEITIRQPQAWCNGLALKRNKKSIPPLCQCLYEAWIFRGVSERVAQPFHGGVQAVVEVHKRVRRPELRSQFLTCDHVAGFIQKCRQHLEWLVLQLVPRPVSPEFTRARVHLDGTEADCLFGIGFRQFRSLPANGSNAVIQHVKDPITIDPSLSKMTQFLRLNKTPYYLGSRQP